MCYLQLSRCYPKRVQGVKPAEGRQGFKDSSDMLKNYKKLKV